MKSDFCALVAIFASAIVLAIASLFGLVTNAYSQADAEAVLSKHITSQATREGAEEYAEARKTLLGDVNGDGKADLVVLYTLEGFDGGNSYKQYLAVFLGHGKTFRFAARSVAGGKLNRNVDFDGIRQRKIFLHTTEYRRNDPACCPTKKGKTVYVLSGGKLKEVRSA